MCHVGIDVGTNTTAPKILMERLGWTLNEAAFATSLYFIFRTIGCFTVPFPPHDEDPHFLRYQRSDDGSEYDRHVGRREQDDALYRHRPGGIWQL